MKKLNKIKQALSIVALLLMMSCSDSLSGFAIVVDSKTYENAKKEIDNYSSLVASRGLKPYLVVDKTGVPDSIRTKLIELYNSPKNPIEGAVFIGDIPIPMIKDAQHFTTAFKMNQERFERIESSVPSDRFYDDFDLQFDFNGRDENKSELFHYSLTANSSQHLQPEIYSARIKAYSDDEATKYDKIKRYLVKAIDADKEKNTIDNIFFFSGHGFISESLDARIDEKMELLEHFPWLQKQQNGISYIDHKRERYVKNRLMNEMQRENLDFAVLHHHGDKTIQYLSAYPDAERMSEYVDDIRYYLRSQMRHAREKGKNLRVVKGRINDNFGAIIPESWYRGAFDKDMIRKDSLLRDSLDVMTQIQPQDFKNYKPNARFVILDACYNGSFQTEKNIASSYIFSDSKNLLVMANSVNVLQDKWVNRYVGLLGLGMRAGYMAKFNCYLESHLFGDPTYSFTPAVEVFDINSAIANESSNYWENKLNSELPAVQILAMEMLMQKHEANYSNEIYNQFITSDDGIVRLSALLELSKYNDDNFINAIKLSMSDSKEMNRRFAVKYCGKSGDERLIPSLVKTASENNTSTRIEFNMKQALSLFEQDKLEDAFEKGFVNFTNYSDHEKVRKDISEAIKSCGAKWVDNCSKIVLTDKKISTRTLYARVLRNNQVHQFVPKYLKYLSNVPENEDEAKLNVVLWEALGWFNYSYQAPKIREKALEISKDSRFSEEIRNEALKTAKRLDNLYI